MHTDLMGYTATSKEQLSIWKNTYDRTNGSQSFQVTKAPLRAGKDSQTEPACQLSEPHSSAFIDLDGDCLADLFLVCKGSAAWSLTYQIWIAEKVNEGSASTYKFAKGGTLPPGAGALSFADMDRDGTIDVVFPSCEGSSCFINIAYNKQMPLCSEKRSGWFGVGPGEDTNRRKVEGDCRDPESNLCVADANFTFDFTVSQDNDLLTRIAVGDVVPEQGLLMIDDLLSQPIQLPLSLGDHNKDGYPDMALITVPSQHNSQKTRLRLLQSVSCRVKGRAQPGCPDDVKKRVGRRTFEMMERNTDAISTLDDVRSVSFFDMAEDGSLDLLLQRLPSSPHHKDSRVITFIQNNFFYDAFMLKVLTSNGACSSYCDKQTVRYKPWGVNYGGASYKFTVLDTNGVRRAQQVGQLAQTAYRALLTPYSYFGLGRTNNYVESLFIGTTKRRANNFVEMEGVIPNSQVIVLPWEQDGNGDSSTWKKELYLSPGDWIPWVMVVLATIIVILLGFVFVLHLNEKREDELERKRAVHAINFDAL
jgi:integrin alpha FG-GAP repeat containing protein 1